MNILIYGNGRDHDFLSELIESCGPMQYRKLRFFKPGSYDDYLAELKRRIPHLIVVSKYGAEGMEAVIAARNLRPDSTVIWFSDDEGFGIQSYRLGCAYFSAKPVTAEIMTDVMAQCALI